MKTDMPGQLGFENSYTGQVKFRIFDHEMSSCSLSTLTLVRNQPFLKQLLNVTTLSLTITNIF